MCQILQKLSIKVISTNFILIADSDFKNFVINMNNLSNNK